MFSFRANIDNRSISDSGTAVPALSIAVDDLDEVLRRVRKKNIAVEYGSAEEPWGVRRFYVRDRNGVLLNVLEHSRSTAL